MMKMNDKFKEVKQLLSCREVVQRYMGLPEKNNSTGSWYKSPFRNEKTASFCVSDKGIHDFGSSKHYDVISFVEDYFNLPSPKEALEMLCHDFNLSIYNEYKTNTIVEYYKKRRQEEQEIKNKISSWYITEMKKICDKIIINNRCLRIYEKNCDFEVLEILYKEEQLLNYYYDFLSNADEETKIKLYLQAL